MEHITNWPQAFTIVGCCFCAAIVLAIFIYKMP